MILTPRLTRELISLSVSTSFIPPAEISQPWTEKPWLWWLWWLWWLSNDLHCWLCKHLQCGSGGDRSTQRDIWTKALSALNMFANAITQCTSIWSVVIVLFDYIRLSLIAIRDGWDLMHSLTCYIKCAFLQTVQLNLRWQTPHVEFVFPL